MYLFTWHDMLMAGRFFQSANIEELAEAMNLESDQGSTELSRLVDHEGMVSDTRGQSMLDGPGLATSDKEPIARGNVICMSEGSSPS